MLTGTCYPGCLFSCPVIPSPSCSVRCSTENPRIHRTHFPPAKTINKEKSLANDRFSLRLKAFATTSLNGTGLSDTQLHSTIPTPINSKYLQFRTTKRIIKERKNQFSSLVKSRDLCVCPSVRPSVRPSTRTLTHPIHSPVPPSVRLSVYKNYKVDSV